MSFNEKWSSMVVRNSFEKLESGVEIAKIVDKNRDVFGVDTFRVKIPKSLSYSLNKNEGHIVSVIFGKGCLKVNSHKEVFNADKGTHFFIPLNESPAFEAQSNDFEFILVSASSQNVVGDKFIVKNNLFLKITSDDDMLLRWITTPQYLSRRVFLYHEKTLLSKNGHPVSWNNTTMFDCTGLPENNEGDPVFRMSYNNNTEINCCYDVPSDSRVRFAKHPYNLENQEWYDWATVDSNTTYNLVETSEDAEMIIDSKGKPKAHRNKHEVYIPKHGYVSLCCLFDPAITGIEKHIKGQYSDYEPVLETIKTQRYKDYLQILDKVDIMIESLSFDYALGKNIKENLYYEAFLKGVIKQKEVELDLMKHNPEREEAMRIFSVEKELYELEKI